MEDEAGPMPPPVQRSGSSEEERSEGPVSVGMAKSIVCNLLGTVPHEPVISPQGFIFEKSAIDSYLGSTGKFCPITREPLKPSDCAKINVLPTQTPMVPQPNSIPNLIGLLKNEVDTIFMENFKVREESRSLKEELSTTLYTEDAAVRLLIKYGKEIEMLKERNQRLVEENARVSALPNGRAFSNDVIMTDAAEVPSGPSQEVLDDMEAGEEQFKEERKAKKKDKDENTLKPPVVTSLSSTAKIPLHSTTARGIRCCALHPENSNCIVTGGVDGTIIVFHREKRRQMDQMKIQMKDPKPITSLACRGDFIVAGALDGQISIFQANLGEWQRGYLKTSSLKHHKKEITAVKLHPRLDLIFACSKDKSYSCVSTNGHLIFHNKGKNPNSNLHVDFQKSEFTSLDIHPGGSIIAFATEKCDLEVWQFTGMTNSTDEVTTNIFTDVARKEHDNEPIKKVCFLADCTSMASISANFVVIWKLKEQTPKQVFQLPKINNVQFDHSGRWVGICNEALHLYYKEGKGDFEFVKTFTDHGDAVMDCAFGTNVICSVGMDRNLELYEKPQ